MSLTALLAFHPPSPSSIPPSSPLHSSRQLRHQVNNRKVGNQCHNSTQEEDRPPGRDQPNMTPKNP